MPVASRLARDTDPGVRREVALSMRDQPADKALDILVDIARGFDGKDRSYLEALGTGATGKEPALYDRLRRELGVKDDPIAWPATFTWIAWRLHVPAAVRTCPRVRGHRSCRSPIAGSPWIRSPSSTTPPRRRRCSVSRSRTARCASRRRVWLLNRMSNDWADYGLRPALKAAGIYDPDSVTLKRGRRAAAAGRISRSSRLTRSSASPETPHAGRPRPPAA